MPNGGLNIETEDRIELLSVGVDIGSATSHMVFSRIVVEKRGVRYVTVDRAIVHSSPIILTPYDGSELIDAARLGEFVEAQFVDAGVKRDDVDTGALILTGVALLRANSRVIAEVFAREAGKMVAVSAGDNMEGALAAQGSGALALSESVEGDLVHVDVGGGTAKVALCRGGRLVAQVAADVGARLVVTDSTGLIVRLEESGRRAAAQVGLELSLGDQMTDEQKQHLARHLVTQLLRAAGLVAGRSQLLRDAPLPAFRPHAVSFSGGVSEYIFGRGPADFGDLGPFLAREIQDQLPGSGAQLVGQNNTGIRATVLGASQYTVQLSGSTIYVSDRQALPVRNVPVLAPPFDMAALSPPQLAAALRAVVRQFDLDPAHCSLAVAYEWQGLATFDRIDAFCRGVRAGLDVAADIATPLVLVSNDDLGRLIGRHFVTEGLVERPVVSIDCVSTDNFDFLDVGEFLAGSSSVPVVVKSLVFP